VTFSFATDGVGGDMLYDKIGECNDLNPTKKHSSSTTLTFMKLTPTKYLSVSKPNTKCGVFFEPPKSPPYKQSMNPK
jgi:hypothetical protein